MDASLAYVLTSVNVADEYFKEKEYTAELEGRLTGITTRAKGLSEQMEQLEEEQKKDRQALAEITQKKEDCEAKLQQLQTETDARIRALEEKLAASEKARTAAENKLDEYMIAMEGQQIQVYQPQKHTNRRRR